MMATQRPYRKMWWGYTDMGAIQIPPNPKYLILTDRTTGKLWWLTFNAPSGTSDGFGYVGINDQLPCKSSQRDGANNGKLKPVPVTYNNCVVFDAYGEPLLGMQDSATLVRLIVDNGLLGVSLDTFNPQIGLDPNAPTITVMQDTGILSFNQEYVTIILSKTTPGAYAWVPTTLIQTPNPSAVQTYD